MRTSIPRGRGFTIIELVAVVAVLALVAAALLLSSSRTRRMAELGQDLAHLRGVGTMTGAYGADNGDRFWTFSWRAGQTYQTLYPDLNNATSDLQAAANQLVYLLRTRGSRPTMPVLNNIAHISYSHLVLAEYSGQKFPWTGMIAAGDTYRAKWASDPDCFDTGCFLPNQPDPTADPMQRRWPFSSSFSPVVALFDLSPAGSRLENSSNYNNYLSYSTTTFGGQLLPLIASPSQKVLVHDQNARYFGPRQPYCTHPEARLPLLMGDSSVAVRAASESNQGWQPNNPTAPIGLVFSYNPAGRPWEPASINAAGDTVLGRFRWTRGGIQGRDFDGPEVH